ncbi:cyclophilin-like domain-containing protein [Hysterangium stoloniferum]|nr:cyclophilin-like domain-containing protein [Hysterangium stoloniferum]
MTTVDHVFETLLKRDEASHDEQGICDVTGHGSNDKLYITHTEHSGQWGQHTAGSSGFRAKQQAPTPLALTPFDCCSLSFQPFEHPVCARNEDGTGTVFDLVNIVPWLKLHDNKHPLTNAPLDPSSLITLHYTRDGKGEIHDPVSFKRFSEHSHIVAIATTGNVFLEESIKGNRDLVADVGFKKSDIIILQNPHAAPAFPKPADPNKEKNVVKSVTAVLPQKKAPLPWNASPYSTGRPGASLTSTSVDPHTATSTALFDEEELMFDHISNPPKGKGKEKDVGKRRAYVRVVTTLGGGSLNLELYCEKAPKTCYNFLMLARTGKYENCLFHRLVPGFMIQTGDPTGTGSGGQSYWGTPFRDEFDTKNAAKHDSRGVLAMANRGPGTNTSQWYITFKPTPNLDNKHTVFGKLVGGEDILDALEHLPRKDGTERPSKPVRIKEVVIYQDPFEDYKSRLARKLAHRAEAETNPRTETKPKEGNDTNWFGVKLTAESEEAVLGGGGKGGIGKYLDLKRPRDGGSGPEEPPETKKRKKLGFGDFEGW